MNTIRLVGLLVVCGLVMAGRAGGAGEVAAPSSQEIADKPALVVAAIKGQTAQDSAAIVVQSLTAIFTSDWTEAKKREHVIALITYAVAAKGQDAAPMMGLVAAGVPSAWLPVIAATSVIAAGDNSPAVAAAMLEAVAGNAEAAAACRAACENPSTVLSPTEIGIVRGIILPTPSAAPAKAPPLPTIIRPAEQYPGQ
jgi:hypothetical protein